MTLNSRAVAAILFGLLFGGVAFSSWMGWWATESTKEPVTFMEGDFAGQANPADIRGSYTFGDIERSFNVAPEILAQAFGITAGNPATFAVKELESIYSDSGLEIGTASVRLFVAYYSALPFDTSDQEIYLPQSATAILLAKGNLMPEQIAYLQAHSVGAKDAVSETPPVESTPRPAETTSTSNEEYIVKGKTTFGELIKWGVSPQIIEQLIGTSIPDPALSVKDHANSHDLDFETLKSTLQAEVDKVKP